MITRDPDVTRLVDRLEARGLVSRERERADRRVVRTRIATEGLRILKELDEPISALHRRQLRHLPPSRLRLLARLLEAILRTPRPGGKLTRSFFSLPAVAPNNSAIHTNT
jgi:DNA-binding MarR family transcriptional regulator